MNRIPIGNWPKRATIVHLVFALFSLIDPRWIHPDEIGLHSSAAAMRGLDRVFPCVVCFWMSLLLTVPVLLVVPAADPPPWQQHHSRNMEPSRTGWREDVSASRKRAETFAHHGYPHAKHSKLNLLARNCLSGATNSREINPQTHFVGHRPHRLGRSGSDQSTASARRLSACCFHFSSLPTANRMYAVTHPVSSSPTAAAAQEAAGWKPLKRRSERQRGCARRAEKDLGKSWGGANGPFQNVGCL
ncbi:hypothetical protein QBC34DRAFT_175734 [Podospora aff. communis PSN243]|uniref:Secreted protein n=1 Tax=Podospora aff. communis PSN243 TaxID=3040156 RepID=A0AAV9H085_9PEZI|nr:hypothetical protein QBC34DRAFT_175734 [Podospora aff. communis PSN243]